MKKFVLSALTLSLSMGFAQVSLPINFETPVTVDAFDNAIGSTTANPFPSGINTSNTVGKLVRPAGITSNWAGSRITLSAPLNFSTNPILAVKVYSTQPVGYNIICKFEGGTPFESSAVTTVSGQWETLYFNFSGINAGTNNQMLFMFNAGAPGNGEEYFFDDIEQIATIPAGSIVGLPIDFETPVTVGSFDGALGSTTANPFPSGINTSNTVGKLVRPAGITSNWAGSRITLSAPLNFSTNPIIAVKVYSTQPIGYNIICKFEGGIPIESSAVTTVTGEWETLYFNFTGQNAGTNNQMLFMFNAGAPGNGEEYFFDDIEQIATIPAENIVALPIDFETPVTVGSFDGALGARVVNPHQTGINTSGFVGQLTRPAGGPFAGSRITLSAPIDFSTNSILSMKVYCTEPVGHPILVKFEGGIPVEVSAVTTKSGEWETITFDFTGLDGSTNNQMLFMFNFNTVGSGEVYYFDDIQLTDGNPVDPGVSIESEELFSGFSIFPNPASEIWTVSNNADMPFSVQLIDIQGKLLSVLHSNVQQNIAIDASQYPAGIYFIEIHAKNQTKTIKVVKE